jgi:hypothetical protein
MVEQPVLPTVMTIDGEARIDDFFSRHGGPGQMGEREGDEDAHTRGWSEIYAADGYRLRCEWSRCASETRMSFSEISPLSVRYPG